MSERYGEDSAAVKRRYQSPYRAEQAAQTRARVLTAAIELFSTVGYVATTIDEVARTAGVSRPTVFAAVGSKRELIKQARDVALAGDDEPTPMPRRPWVDELRAEPDASVAVALYAAAMRAIHQRAARLELAISAAAGADPELATLADVAHQQRHFGCRLVAEELAAKHPLAGALGPDEAADLLFTLASPEVYQLLTDVRAWSPDRYESWLRRTLQAQLFTPDPEG